MTRGRSQRVLVRHWDGSEEHRRPDDLVVEEPLTVGADRIVFGSNAPAGIAAHGVNGIRLVGFSPRDEALILGENLRAIYDL